jgi:hypothetical protein
MKSEQVSGLTPILAALAIERIVVRSAQMFRSIEAIGNDLK